MNISRVLAEFVANTRYEDIPASVIENQKKSVMDAVGITFGASTLGDGCRQMVQIAEELAAGGRGEATVLGFDKKLPVSWAAFANAAMAHSLDFGDTHQKSTIHPNSSSFPAALAVAEQLGNVDGKAFLTALVLGSEVAIRIAGAADINTLDGGFYVPTIYSSYGAVAAVAKLMNLTAEQIVSAFSFNLCQTICSSELTNNKTTVIRSVRESFAARNAVLACHMAKADLIGFEAPLEGKLGLYHMMLQDQYTAQRVVEGLGQVWEAEQLTYKVWPCCFGNHSPITGALQLMKEHDLQPEDIRHIQVSVGAQNIALCEPLEQRRNPDTAIFGKFSIPFNVASAILKGNVTIDSYTPECLYDAEIRALTAKIDYTYMEDWQRGRETWATVAMETSKGDFEIFVSSPFGTPENPMDDASFEAKFDSCAAKAHCPKTPEQLAQLKSVIRSLDKLENIRSFADLL